MIKAIHNWVSQYIHIPTNLEKLILFLLLAWLWLVTLPFVGLVLVTALGIFCATSFKMESVNIAICAVCGLMTILHVIDIIGRVKGGEESSGGDSEGDSNPLL
ncbi:MAG: hypothetical protein J5977_08195 [Fibrobacter sp.]|nr:hypothetical protein [Fibrobacter sp.]